MNASEPVNYQRFARTKGEVYVWITSMGLVIGLVMILFLLGLIAVQGFFAFWPRRVAELAFRPENPPQGSTTGLLHGEINRVQQLRAGGQIEGRPEKEFQIRTSNRDTYGSSFRWVPESHLVSITFPVGIIEIERMEFGDAIGFPATLNLKQDDGSTSQIPADSADFLPTLKREVRLAATRRREIQRLERREIGAINSEMTSLRNRERALRRQNRLTEAEQQAIARRMEELEQHFETLAAEARQLRAAQEQNSLTLRLASGQQITITTGNIVSFFFPNDLSFFGRLGLTFENFWDFLSNNPREANTEGGIFPAIFGTAVMTILMSIAVMPFGVIAAIYLREYAKQGLLVRSVRIAVNNLAGVPSIVFGVFGLGFFVYLMGGTIDQLFFSEALPTPTFGTGGVLWAALTLALLTVPVVIVATEEALAAVPRGVREGSLACGASKWQTIQRVVLPAAAPGILTGLILAMARGAGEVAPLMLVGVVKLAPSLPIDTEYPFIHLERKFMHLGFHIFDLGFQSPDAEAAKPMVFATTFLLILLVVVLNLAAIIIREHLRKKYATGAF